ncbi:MAG: hypothetical protein HUK14_05040 [Muribaculaceae bacterium]|nr:hypothetical protein [Muribaculaceae bacterium]
MSYEEKVMLLESSDLDNNCKQAIFNEFSDDEKEQYMRTIEEPERSEHLSESEIKPTINCTYEDLINSRKYRSAEEVHNRINKIITKYSG